jgi:N-acetyl-gamma-glutamyl-phosphate reductase
MKKVRAGIAGGAGYTGGELVRILLSHPLAELAFVHSRSNAGKPLSKVHQDLLGDTDISFTAELRDDVDVLFLCLGHGESRRFLQENTVPQHVRIIDLSNDFRLPEANAFGERSFVYGLPELNRRDITRAQHIANPGCFATAIQLGLLPLAEAGVAREAHVTAITGSTGAGQSLSASSHFSWRSNNIQAYKTLTHQHLGEIGASLRKLRPMDDIPVHFVPWRGDFTRGIFASIQIHCPTPLTEVEKVFESFYSDAPFTKVSRDPIFLKQVVNTNKCLLQLEQSGDRLVVHSAIDNLLKGASGQAVQNMNLLFGLPEEAGLRLKASFF